MDETGIVRFPGNLDPRAQEFRPRYPNNHFNHHPHQLTLFTPPPPPPSIYYPYTPTYPSAAGGVGYHQFPTQPPPPPAYVSPNSLQESLPLPSPPLPQPLATPSRTLLLSSVPTDVSESTVRRELEVFGDVRAVQLERLAYEGLVTVHFYDLRHAQLALTEIRDQHMQQQFRLRKHYNNSFMAAAACNNPLYGVENLAGAAIPLPPPARGLISGQAVWAQFIVPTTSGIPEGNNQGTIVVFNLDSNVSTSSLKEIFQAFGTVKELRETPSKRHQKFVEFYDIRDAAKALVEMNGKEIQGNHVVIEFSRPGGQSRRFLHSNSSTTTPTGSTTNSVIDFSSANNYQTRTSMCSPAAPHRKMSGSNVPPRSYLCQTPQSSKKSKGNGGGNGSRSSSKTAGAIETAMASLCILDENGIEERIAANGVSRKNTKKSNNGNNSSTTATTTTTKQQQLTTRSRSAKGRIKSLDSRFLINEDAILESNRRDSRTTVMIKNIPNKYSQKLILNMLDNHCIHCNEQIADSGNDHPLSAYDFLYLPIDFNNKCNVGYGFVNMTSPEATWRLYKAFHHQSWEVFNSRKICEVTYARVQGLEALKEHFKNSKFPSVTEEIFPVVFSPPRDGRHLSEPLPIFGHAIPPPPAAINTTSDDHYELDGSDWPAQEVGVTINAEANELVEGGYRFENGEAAADDDYDDDDDDDDGNNNDEEGEDIGYCGRSSRSGSGGDYGYNDENSSWQ